LLRRPFVLTGVRDTAALGIAVSGLFLIGPLELLMPARAVLVYQHLVWLLLAGLYALSLSLVILLERPRLVIYNVTMHEFRPVLAASIDALDPDARWAGNSLYMPRLEIELHVVWNLPLRNVTLAANGDAQNFAGWRQLEAALVSRLRKVQSPPYAWGACLTLAASIVLVAMVWLLARDPVGVTQAFNQMLRL
jgi:hypothetical protein